MHGPKLFILSYFFLFVAGPLTLLQLPSALLPRPLFFLNKHKPPGLSWFALFVVRCGLFSRISRLGSLVPSIFWFLVRRSRLDECVVVCGRLSCSRSPRVCIPSFSLSLLHRILLFPFPRAGALNFPLTMLYPSSEFDLNIRQQPTRARVAGGKEKGV